jgi:hypothetical protein
MRAAHIANGQARVKVLEENHVRQIAAMSEKLQELQNTKIGILPPGSDFLKRGGFREVSSRAQDSEGRSHNLFCG